MSGQTIDLEYDTAELVSDGLQNVASTALANLREYASDLPGGETGAMVRADFLAEIERADILVRVSAGELVNTIERSYGEAMRGHGECESFGSGVGAWAWELAHALDRLTTEVERGWTYGDDLVRSLDRIARQAMRDAGALERGELADTFDVGAPLVASVPAEVAGMVAA